MAKRMILMVVLMTIFITVLGFVKFRQFQAMAQQFAAMQPPPDAVTTIVAARETWPVTMAAIGTVAGGLGVTGGARRAAGDMAGHHGRDRNSGGGAGSDGQRRSAGRRRSDCVRVGADSPDR